MFSSSPYIFCLSKCFLPLYLFSCLPLCFLPLLTFSASIRFLPQQIFSCLSKFFPASPFVFCLIFLPSPFSPRPFCMFLYTRQRINHCGFIEKLFPEYRLRENVNKYKHIQYIYKYVYININIYIYIYKHK